MFQYKNVRIFENRESKIYINNFVSCWAYLQDSVSSPLFIFVTPCASISTYPQTEKILCRNVRISVHAFSEPKISSRSRFIVAQGL